MQFFCPVINIHQQQIIQQQIFDKVIFIKAFLIGNQQILNLERSHLTDHINVIGLSLNQNNIFQLVFIEHFKKLIALQHLTLCQRFREDQDGFLVFLHCIQGRRQRFSFRIHYT